MPNSCFVLILPVRTTDVLIFHRKAECWEEGGGALNPAQFLVSMISRSSEFHRPLMPGVEVFPVQHFKFASFQLHSTCPCPCLVGRYELEHSTHQGHGKKPHSGTADHTALAPVLFQILLIPTLSTNHSANLQIH